MRAALARFRHTVEGAGGSALVSPVAGEGTTISLRIPVSASVVEGLLTQVGDTRYMIRLSEIERCVDMRSVERLPGQDMIDLGGEAVPVRDVRTLFGAEPQGDETQVVVVAGKSGRMGLLVDKVFDTHQAVVKPLGRMLHGVAGLGGTMILGDGTPAMLIDTELL
jgi:two-component system chemotaxis sensor kinase CheA